MCRYLAENVDYKNSEQEDFENFHFELPVEDEETTTKGGTNIEAPQEI